MTETGSCRLIFLFMIVFSLSSFTVQALDYRYELKLSNDHGDLGFGSIDVHYGRLRPSSGNYSVRIVSFAGTPLFSQNFSVSHMIVSERFDVDLGRMVFDRDVMVDAEEVVLYLPYSSSAKNIEVFDSGHRKVLDVDVSYFAMDHKLSGADSVYKDGAGMDGEYPELSKKERGKADSLFVFFVVLSALLIFLIVVMSVLSKSQTKKR